MCGCNKQVISQQQVQDQEDQRKAQAETQSTSFQPVAS